MSVATCSQVGCQIETSGRCLEGFNPPETCPYYAQSPSAPEETAPVSDQELASYSAQELIPIPSGEALTERQAAEVRVMIKRMSSLSRGQLGAVRRRS